jgi:hypothetical protein
MPNETAVSRSAVKKPPGRPKKPEGEKLEQFSIRLPPKLKFGLELLARAQNRSLSQVVEWSVRVGLNSYKINSDAPYMDDLLDRAWKEPWEFDRYYLLYGFEPRLLSFEDRTACALVDRSIENARVEEGLAFLVLSLPSRDPKDERRSKQAQKAADSQRRAIYFEFVRLNWERIKEGAMERFNTGKSTVGVSIVQLIFPRTPSDVDPFATMQAFIDIADGKVDDQDFREHALKLEQELNWSKNLGH